jgi:hypothetical protein
MYSNSHAEPFLLTCLVDNDECYLQHLASGLEIRNERISMHGFGALEFRDIRHDNDRQHSMND